MKLTIQCPCGNTSELDLGQERVPNRYTSTKYILSCPEKSVSAEKDISAEPRVYKSETIEPKHPDASQLAVYLLETIRSHKPNFKADVRKVNGWALDIDKAIRLDGRTPAELREVIDWCHKSEAGAFWRGNILSGLKLREQFDQLQLRMKPAKLATPFHALNPGRPPELSGALPKFTPPSDKRSEDEKGSVAELAAQLKSKFSFGGGDG